MRVLVTGATGFIGRSLCAHLSKSGHTLVALSRDPARARRQIPALADAFAWNPTDGSPPIEALSNIEAIVHLAGESVAGRWNSAKRTAIRESRVLGTRHLVDGLTQLHARPKVLISASAIGYYGDRDEELLTEEASPGGDFLAQVCQEWESEAARAEGLGVRVVRLRIGIVLGPDGGALQAMLPIFRVGLGGPLGSGQQWWSWIHRDDVVGAILHALENHKINGPINVTAPQPVRQREFARILGSVLKRPAFLPAPAFALRTVLGEFSQELLSSKRVIPQRLQATDYRFRFSDLDSALAEILQR
ncbi:MAG: TIGR01777 family oxidoreductase [Candidatus Bipolaricaulota bacterium]|nr:TIGR01777 family oxidoreductase [Candidatus Bipolaricaulota bacterium]